jgi:hypothetical protein
VCANEGGQVKAEDHNGSTTGISVRCMGIVFAVGLAAFLLKGALAWNTIGTNDISFREAYRDILRQAGALRLYQADIPIFYAGKFYQNEPFNQPPLAIAMIDLWARGADWSGIPFRTVLRLSSSLADLLSLLLVVQLSKHVPGLRVSCVALTALAACPVSILISGFHGNSDPIMMLLVLLSLYGLEVLDSPMLCGLALGLAMEVKIVPAILVLPLLLYLRNWRSRIVCGSSILIAALLPALPYLLADPGAVIKKVLGYRSFSGVWGLTSMLDPRWGYDDYGRFVVIAVLSAVSLWLNYPRPRARLFDQWGMLFFLFLLLTPGFGLQYLAWLVPWVVTLGPLVILGQYVLNGAYIFLAYTVWCGGLPWYFANSMETGAWNVWLRAAQIPVWASIVPTLCAYGSRIWKPSQSSGDGNWGELRNTPE